MKNVCFLIGNMSLSGGTERVTSIIANELSRENYQVSILSLCNGTDSFFKLDESITLHSLYSKKMSMKINFVSCCLKIRKYLLTNKIDSLIVVDSISCVFTVPACIGLKLQHICWEHFNLNFNLNSSFRDLGRWMAAKFCNKIFTLTERDKGFWERKYNLLNSNKVIAIPNPSPYGFQENQATLSSKTILCVGRLTYQKGFDLLIPAWAKIAPKLNGWKVIIVGTGEDENTLKELAIQYNISDSVEFAGQQKSMDLYYKKASFFCMSSRFEGLPMVLLEAQSYGLPIVAFDCDTGPAEIIEHNINGLLVKAEDTDQLTNSILKMISLSNSDYIAMSSNAKINSYKYSIDSIVKKWLSII